MDATFTKGNLGPLDVGLGFLPPTGVGLSLEAGGFKGGGFLIVDTDKGEYAGGLELDFIGLVTVKALALLTTKFPDGHRGFSLLIIISAEFPPIQLGFGFTLVGVGGLIGLSRTVDSDALREGVHQGAIDSVLFPVNIVANAARIVNDLRRLFPPAEDHFLVGPMVKFGWGTPTIISLEFGLILDLPRPAFFIIGRLRLGLPFQDAPLIDIRVAFAGGIDFEAGQLWFDGTLLGSRLLTFTLTGDMAIRLYWKENANFVLTVGGFHPAYTPPPMQLGGLQRLGITIFDGNPRLRAETYVAITSNTVQFGAKAELYFGVDIFNVYGFIALDVLIQFDPFRFIATLTAMLAVRSGSSTLMAIRIDALLEGPAPWHAKGTGHFEISLIIDIEIDVGFEVTIGDAAHDTLPAVAVLPQAGGGGRDRPSNWRAVLPVGTNLHVSLRAYEPPPGAIVLHPFGSLEIVEKLVPLNLPVQKLGTQRIGDGKVFAHRARAAGADARAAGAAARAVRAGAVRRHVRRAEALEPLVRALRRRRPGRRRQRRQRRLRQEPERRATKSIYMPNRPKRPRFRVAQKLFDTFARTGAVSQSSLSAAQTAPSPLGAEKVIVAAERFAVASKTDLAVHDAAMVFTTEAEAHAAMQPCRDQGSVAEARAPGHPVFPDEGIMSFGEYSFLPWLRRGIANELQTPAASASRASVDVTVRVRSDAGGLDVAAAAGPARRPRRSRRPQPADGAAHGAAARHRQLRAELSRLRRFLRRGLRLAVHAGGTRQDHAPPDAVADAAGAQGGRVQDAEAADRCPRSKWIAADRPDDDPAAR